MLTSIRQVNEEFFRIFYGLKVPIGGVEKPILCRYARKSSNDYVEEQDNQIYPCIAIQDYNPNPKPEWYIDMKAYLGGKSSDGLSGYLYQRPIWLEFRYDVSIAAKSYNDYMALQDYFMENFVYGKRFIFNAQLSGEDLVGDIVPYEVRDNDIPRTDGVFETNYEFTCSVWLYPQKPKEVDLVKTILLGATPVPKGGEGKTPLEVLRHKETFKVRVLPYSEEYVEGNSNCTKYGYATIVGNVAELLKEDVSGFSVELYGEDNVVIDKKTTNSKGEVNLLFPESFGDYVIKLSKQGHNVKAHFSYKEVNLGLVFLWVFE